MNEVHLGSEFDDFLAEEGLLEEADAIADKRGLAYPISQLMKEKELSKAELACRRNTSRAALNRLLAPEHRSVTLYTMDKAARSLGMRLRLMLV